jgi:hypothetical protein
MAPLAAFSMAILLYTYSITSINAAKRNAALHRAADGGQLDMRRESLRRHGVLEKPVGTSGLELFRDAGRGVDGGGTGGGESGGDDGDGTGNGSVESRGIASEVVESGRTRSAGAEASARGRTGNERSLEGWKGSAGVDLRAKGLPISVEGAGGGGGADGER